MVADVDLGLKRPATFPLSTWEKLLVVMGEADICPRLSTLPPITHVTMLYCCIYMVFIAMWMIVFTKMKELKVEVMIKDMGVGLKILDKINPTIMYKGC